MNLKINDIIGDGKSFEPPFSFYDKCIRDKNGLVVINFDGNHCYYEDAWSEMCVLAEYIVDLLNKDTSYYCHKTRFERSDTEIQVSYY